MHGFPLDQCKRLIERCLKDLDDEDSFQVVLFAGSASTFAPAPVPATASNVRKAIEYVKTARGGGGTEFLPALEKALKQPVDRDRSRIVLFLSDGYIGYETQVLKYMHENLGSANLFPMGIGTSANRYLIDGMARIGKGKPFYLRPDEDAEETVGTFFEYVSRPSITGIEVNFEGLPVYDLWPEKIPDLFAGRPVTLVGRFGRGATGSITLRGWLAGSRWEQTLEVDLPDREPANPGLPLLWARKRIGELSDRLAIGNLEEKKAEEQITKLSLRYSLMSAYTSFVAIDSEVRNPGGESQAVSVPIPLPDQVSPLAAPGHAYPTPKGMKASAPMALNGFLCRKQALPPCSVGGRDEMALSESTADRALPAESREEEGKEDDRQSGIGEIRIRGTLEEDAVRKVMGDALQAWAEEEDFTSTLGPVTLALTVDEDGNVSRAWVQDTEGLDEEALDLLLELAEGLSFPGSEACSTVFVELMF
jgi:Ca-activated chloride channel family protein